jgi:aryl-alcohol dehydrogenase-like predicted oxidoreductase
LLGKNPTVEALGLVPTDDRLHLSDVAPFLTLGLTGWSTILKHNPLGTSAISIPPIVFGGNVFGWSADEATSFRLLDRLVEAGLTAIDTADMYSTWVLGHKGGESEAIIGRWIKKRGKRDDLVIMTKVGMQMPDGKGLSEAWIKRSVAESLQRLETDYIDLYQSHQDDKETPLAETLGAFAGLIQSGKVRAIGASNYEADRLKEALDASDAHGLPRYVSLQPHYNLVERPLFEDALEAVCKAESLGVIPYWSLASGYLTGKYRSKEDLSKSAARGQGVGKYLEGKGPKVVAALDQVAAETKTTPTQVALAWLIARPSITAPIASASKPEQLDDLIKAATLKLSPAQVAALDSASA